MITGIWVLAVTGVGLGLWYAFLYTHEGFGASKTQARAEESWDIWHEHEGYRR